MTTMNDGLIARVHALPPEIFNHIRSEVLSINQPTLRTHVTANYKFPVQLHIHRSARHESIKRYLEQTILIFTSWKDIQNVIRVLARMRPLPSCRLNMAHLRYDTWIEHEQSYETKRLAPPNRKMSWRSQTVGRWDWVKQVLAEGGSLRRIETSLPYGCWNGTEVAKILMQARD